jgi:hypothetical protein
VPETSAFLTRLAIALNRSSAYPPDHPVLASGIDDLLRDIDALTSADGEVAIAVGRDRLHTSGGETDPSNPLHRGLAAKLHRQQVGAVRFRRGVQATELSALLEDLTASRVAMGNAAEWPSYPNVHITGFSAGDLAFSDGPDGGDARDFWRGIAEVVLGDARSAEMASGTVLMQAVGRHVETESGRAAVAGELSRLAARAASTSDDAPQAGAALARLLGGLDTNLVSTLLASMTDGSQKSRFMTDAVEGVPIDSVVPLLSAAADASDETLSHALLRLLTKLAVQADGPLNQAVEADAALRDAVQSLVQNWTLDDPNPHEYRNLLVRLTRNEGEAAGLRSLDDGTERLFLIGLETGTDSAVVRSALDKLLEQSRFDVAIEAVSQAGIVTPLLEECRTRIMTSPHFAAFLSSERACADVIVRIAEWAGSAATAEPLLAALEAADTAATRRRLLSTLEKLGPSIAPQLIARLTEKPWFVRRNMLVLLGSLDEHLQGFSALPYISDPDARVRREAVKIAVRHGADRAAAMEKGLTDSSELVLVAALAGLHDNIPVFLLPIAMEIAEREELARETRALAVRAAATHRSAMVFSWLMGQAGRRRWPFRLKLGTRTEILPAVLSALRQNWSEAPEVRRLLLLAARSNDVELRTAAAEIAQT